MGSLGLKTRTACSHRRNELERRLQASAKVKKLLKLVRPRELPCRSACMRKHSQTQIYTDTKCLQTHTDTISVISLNVRRGCTINQNE